jgi:hypothetical protein
MKKCSSSLAIKEMQIKTTLRFYLTLVRIATIKKTTDNKCWQGCKGKGTLTRCWWEHKLVQPLWKTIWIPERNNLKEERLIFALCFTGLSWLSADSIAFRPTARPKHNEGKTCWRKAIYLMEARKQNK